MGANFARDLADGIGGIDLATAVAVHLSANHYPPVHPDFVPVALWAIETVGDDPNGTVVMPNGITKTAWQVVEGLHLSHFCEADSDY